MKKNGTTSAGRTRWRCKDPSCGASASRAYDRRSADLRAGLDWLFSKESQEERRIPARSLRRANLLMWDLWPPVPLDRTTHDVVHLDGIHVHRDAVVLIAVSGGHVVGWHVARSETGEAWSSLLSRIAPPLAAVCDGGGGVLKALRDVWPSTRVQRCLFHVCMNITGLTGLRPRLEAGRRLRKVAVALSRVSDAATAAEWMASYNRWERDFAGFLDQKSRWEDGTVADQHMRLAKARRMVRRRIREGQPFTFLDPPDGCAEPVPPTNNLIESWNRASATSSATTAACPWRGGSRRFAGGATSTPRSRRRTRGSWPTPSRTNGSRSSTRRHGRKARGAHGRRPASRCSTEPGSPGTTSTAPPNTTVPPSRLRPDTHFGL